MHALGLFDARARLGTLSMPVLVVTGDKDNTVPFHAQQELVKGLPNACQVMVKEAGHAVSVDQPVVFNTLLLDFILERSLQPAVT
jgi:pimeloyl-ACP methyl ester carboxylesterase